MGWKAKGLEAGEITKLVTTNVGLSQRDIIVDNSRSFGDEGISPLHTLL